MTGIFIIIRHSAYKNGKYKKDVQESQDITFYLQKYKIKKAMKTATILFLIFHFLLSTLALAQIDTLANDQNLYAYYKASTDQQIQAKTYFQQKVKEAKQQGQDSIYIALSFHLSRIYQLDKDTLNMMQQCQNIVQFSKYDEQIEQLENRMPHHQKFLNYLLLKKYTILREMVIVYSIQKNYEAVLECMRLFRGKYRIGIPCRMGEYEQKLYLKYMLIKKLKKANNDTDELLKHCASILFNATYRMKYDALIADVEDILLQEIAKNDLKEAVLKNTTDIQMEDKYGDKEVPIFYFYIKSAKVYVYSREKANIAHERLNNAENPITKAALVAELKAEYETILVNSRFIKKLKKLN